MATDQSHGDAASAGASSPRWPPRPRPGSSSRPAARGGCTRFPRIGCARRSRDWERDYSEQYGKARHRLRSRADAGRAVRLRARSLALQRLPPLRRRLRRGEQPVARSADPVDPRAVDGQGQGHRLHRRRSLLRAGRSPRAGPLLRADRLSALPESALHQGLSDRRHLDREGRHRRHRLRLVHRLPLLHGGLPVRRAPLQLAACRTCRPTQINTNNALPRQPAAAAGVVEKCTLCIQRTRAGRYPACVEVCPIGARKFGNMLDPDSEIRYIIENKRVLLLKQELNTMPKFFYFYGT